MTPCEEKKAFASMNVYISHRNYLCVLFFLSL